MEKLRGVGRICKKGDSNHMWNHALPGAGKNVYLKYYFLQNGGSFEPLVPPLACALETSLTRWLKLT